MSCRVSLDTIHTNYPYKPCHVYTKKNARAAKHVSTLFHSHRDETNDVNMANPVCFFDIEIGGQPAGRIEMTVRAIPWTTTIPDGSIVRSHFTIGLFDIRL